MATITRSDNYFKVRDGTHAREFFFNAKDKRSFGLAYTAALSYLLAMKRQGKEPQMSLYAHADTNNALVKLPCVGGCERCAPRPADLSLDEELDPTYFPDRKA